MNSFHRLCFICFGNICRSPAVAAILESLIKEKGISDHFFIDSMALTTHYLGRPVDLRMRQAGEKKGIAMEHTAQLFKATDFQRFDLLFAVNEESLEVLKGLAPTEADKEKAVLVTAFSQKFRNQDIPDPYYGGPYMFDTVVEMAFDACEGILKQLGY